MTCKDNCLHFERCNSIMITQNGNTKSIDTYSSPDKCCWFKDKHRRVEFPIIAYNAQEGRYRIITHSAQGHIYYSKPYNTREAAEKALVSKKERNRNA